MQYTPSNLTDDIVVNEVAALGITNKLILSAFSGVPYNKMLSGIDGHITHSDAAVLMDSSNIAHAKKALIISSDEKYIEALLRHIARERDDLTLTFIKPSEISTIGKDSNKMLYDSIIICGVVDTVPQMLYSMISDSGKICYGTIEGRTKYISLYEREDNTHKQILKTYMSKIETLCTAKESTFTF